MTEKMNEEVSAVEKADGASFEALPEHMKSYFEELLRKSKGTMLCALDATFPGVTGIPKRHAYTVNLKLQFGQTARGVPEFGEESITQELGFQGNWFTVTVPYKAIWLVWAGDEVLLLAKHVTVGAVAAIAQLCLAAEVGLQPGPLKDELDAVRGNRSHLKPV